MLFVIFALSAIWYRSVITSRQKLQNHSKAKASTPSDDQIPNTKSNGSKEFSEAQVYDFYCEYYNRMGKEDEITNLDNYLDRE